MAIGVCYLDKDGRPAWDDVEIYLKQPFYESAHSLVDRDLAGTLLTRILTMGYDGNVLVQTGQHGMLLRVLDDLEALLGRLPQLDEFRRVVCRAQQDSMSLVLWGDMYPELDKELRHRTPVTPCGACGEVHKSAFWDVCDCGHIRNQGASAP